VTVDATALEYVLALFAAHVLGDGPEELMMSTGRPRRRSEAASEAAADDEAYAALRHWWSTQVGFWMIGTRLSTVAGTLQG